MEVCLDQEEDGEKEDSKEKEGKETTKRRRGGIPFACGGSEQSQHGRTERVEIGVARDVLFVLVRQVLEEGHTDDSVKKVDKTEDQPGVDQGGQGQFQRAEQSFDSRSTAHFEQPEYPQHPEHPQSATRQDLHVQLDAGWLCWFGA